MARWILEKAGWKGPARRLWISSQTDKAIREGFTHLRPAAEYDNLFRSARARSEADWLVGLNVTRALTCRHNAQLSAGRVQTPTLAPHCGAGGRPSAASSPGVLDGHREAARLHRHLAGSGTARRGSLTGSGRRRWPPGWRGRRGW